MRAVTTHALAQGIQPCFGAQLGNFIPEIGGVKVDLGYNQKYGHNGHQFIGEG